MRSKKEEAKKVQGLAEWYNQQAEALEAQIIDVKDLKAEAARLRREARKFERMAKQLRGGSVSETEDEE